MLKIVLEVYNRVMVMEVLEDIVINDRDGVMLKNFKDVDTSS